jgi:hypothetical protein
MTMIVEELLAGNAEAITRKLMEQAQAGNAAAMALLARSLLPQCKGVPIRIDLPELQEASDAPTAMAAIYASVCAGELTLADGNALIRMVEAFLRAKEKTGSAERRPEQEKTVEIAAPQPAAVPLERQPHAHAVIPGRREGGEPETRHARPVGMDSGSGHCVSAGMTAALENTPPSLSRLRQEVLSSTSTLPQTVRTPAAIVSHCIPLEESAAPADRAAA